MDLQSILILFIIGCILITSSILISSITSKVGISILLVFLGIGILSGSDGIGRISFHSYEIANIISNLSLAVILLDGGMRTKISSVKIALIPALSLATIGVLITAGLTGIMASYLFKIHLIYGFLVAAILASTDAAAIFTSGKGLNERVISTLEIESGSNDPMAVFLTTSIIKMIQINQLNFNFNILILYLIYLIKQFILGIILGSIGAWIVKKIINKIILVSGLYPLLVLSIGILIFSLTNLLDGSGILAIYLYGFFIGNYNIRNRNSILQIFDGIAWFSQITMFLILGLLVSPSSLLHIALPSLILSFWMILLVRPLSVFIVLLPFSNFNIREKIFISWMGLRGAVPIILALFPIIAQIEHAMLFFNIAFFIVLISLIIQGSFLNFFANKTKVLLPSIILPIHRTNLDINIKKQWEQFTYILDTKTWCIGTSLRDLYMPRKTFITALFRKGKLLRPTGNTILQKDDIICIIGHENNLKDLGKLFSKTVSLSLNQKFFGDFILDAEAKLYDIAKIYSLKLNKNINVQQSIGKLLISLMKNNTIVVGDNIKWNNILWTIAEKENNKITRIGIKSIKKY
ncbi:potassium/proton antiporter [Enterobacteriaceae endosymbiont of Plateumaris consimilis]|uniref:potassium/proton antiporter n=1 Tax=Enterobacteriaceae endosymbiont of Plateumaris consimilis TaxID=2675794 RepID=UPI001448C059|nr:potassium/proton antiporter [Enterobacteriaceae endosymbiont of Plateumaris consimilis]QJC28505.1 potassium/proton antiporter [Enterobacteriaceae endosymbiont of Plateumaris consimilis]